MSIINLLTALVGGFTLSLILTNLSIRLFPRIGLMDIPDLERKKHKAPMPLGGGFPIILSFFIILFAVQINTGFFTSGLIEFKNLLSVFLASLVILVAGFIDDKYRLSAKVAIIGPVLAVLIVHLGGINVSQVTGFSGPISIGALLSFVLVSAWLLVMMFAVKFSDGIDGLATSNAITALSVLTALTMTRAYYQPDMTLMALILLSVLIGFFIYNRPPAKIYLGESGSVWLGFILGVFAIIGGSKLLTVLIVMAIPALDAVFVIFRRLRAGASPVIGDRRHLHHMLRDSGWSEFKILSMYSSVSVFLGLLSLVLPSYLKYLLFLFIIVLFIIQFAYGRK